MNKLVSKNPILRFKLEKKIVFAQKGSGRWFYRGKEVFSNDGGKTFVIDEKGLYVLPGMNRNLVLADKVGRGAYKVGNDWYKIGGNGRPAVLKFAIKTSNSEPNSKKSSIKPPVKQLKKPTQSTKKEKYNPVKFQDLIEHNWGLDNKNNTLDNTILIPYGIGQTPIVEQTPITTTQPSINKPSPKKKYNKQNLLKRNKEVILLFLAPKPLTMELVLTDITNKVNLPTYELVPSTPNITIPTNDLLQLPVLQANRSDIRQLIRDITGNDPYDYTFLLRRALRKYINGEDYNSNLLKIFGGDLSKFDKYKASNLSQYYKQGGQLPSKSPIKRFKERNLK